MKKGFTLIELLVVVLIIGILSAVALPQYTQAVQKSRSTEALTVLGSIRYAAERYRLQTGNWPTSFDVLDIEVPTSTNFTYSIEGAKSASATNFVVSAESKKAPVYVLNVTTTAAGASTRCCGAKITTDTNACTANSGDGLKMCKAISSTSGGNGNF